MDHIPVSLHDMIRKGRCVVDLAPFFQAAAVAANGNVVKGAGPGGVVLVPVGVYPVSCVGIRDTAIIGEHREGSRIVAAEGAQYSQFLLDAMLDRDGITRNTSGGGSASNLSIDAAGKRACGLRTYGGGCVVRDVTITGARVGLAAGLPIWSTFMNIYTQDCETGIHTFGVELGDSGTSTTFVNCWTNRSRKFGFHVTQLMYSSFINCVSQDSDHINFFLEGNCNGSPAAYSLQMVGCGVEGGGKPFYIKKCRDFTLLGARIVSPGPNVDHVTLDDSAGSIRDFSTVSPPLAPFQSVRLVNHGAPLGAVLLDNSIAQIDPESTPYFTIIGGRINGEAGIQTPAWRLNLPSGSANARLEAVGSSNALVWRSSKARLAAFGLDGGTVLSAVPNADLMPAIEPGEVAISLTDDSRSLRFSFKDATGRMRAVEMVGRLVDG